MLEIIVAKQNDIRKKVLELAKLRSYQTQWNFQIKSLPIKHNIHK
jgi:hypothetical protein